MQKRGVAILAWMTLFPASIQAQAPQPKKQSAADRDVRRGSGDPRVDRPRQADRHGAGPPHDRRDDARRATARTLLARESSPPQRIIITPPSSSSTARTRRTICSPTRLRWRRWHGQGRSELDRSRDARPLSDEDRPTANLRHAIYPVEGERVTMDPYDRALIPTACAPRWACPRRRSSSRSLEGMKAPNAKPDTGLGHRIISHDYLRRGGRPFASYRKQRISDDRYHDRGDRLRHDHAIIGGRSGRVTTSAKQPERDRHDQPPIASGQGTFDKSDEERLHGSYRWRGDEVHIVLIAALPCLGFI